VPPPPHPVGTKEVLAAGGFPTQAYNSVMRLVGAGSMGGGRLEQRKAVAEIHALIPSPDRQSYEVLIAGSSQNVMACIRQGLLSGHLSGAANGVGFCGPSSYLTAPFTRPVTQPIVTSCLHA